MIEHRYTMLDTNGLADVARMLRQLAADFDAVGVDTSGSRLRIEFIFTHVAEVIPFPFKPDEPQDAA